MLDQINSWLENGSHYAEGLALLEKFAPQKFIVRILKTGENSFNRQKLIDELLALRDAEPAIPEPNTSAVVSTTASSLNDLEWKPNSTIGSRIRAKIQAATAIQTAYTPKPVPALIQVKREIEQNYAEMRGTHHLLSTEREGDGLKEIAKRLVQLGKKNALLWERYNYLTEGGEDPEPDRPAPPAPVMIDYNLIKKRESIKKALNRAQLRIKGQDKPNAKTLELIEQKKLELAEIDERIKQIREGGAK